MLSNEYIIDNVTKLLPIDATAYDDQLNILVGGAVSKLMNEGIDNIFDEGENLAFDYIICVSYQVASDLDLDVDLARLRSQYITRANTLRTCIDLAKQN